MVDVAHADQLLTTTRSVRKRLDLLRPVEPAVIERAIEVAFQAPTGSNSQGWHFVVVTDPEKRAGLAALYRRAFHAYVSQQVPGRPQLPPDDPRARQLPRTTGDRLPGVRRPPPSKEAPPPIRPFDRPHGLRVAQGCTLSDRDLGFSRTRGRALAGRAQVVSRS